MRASAHTVRQRRLEDGLVSRWAAKKPLFSRKNTRDRLIFCRLKNNHPAIIHCLPGGRATDVKANLKIVLAKAKTGE